MKLPALHPLDAEQRFTEVFQRLKRTVQSSPQADEKIGTFWDPEWQRAPFEEELTLRQLASLTIDVLIKKKSFNPEKMTALAIALERGLGEQKKTLSLVPPAVTVQHHEQLLQADFSLPVEAIIAFYGRQQLARDVFQETQFHRFFNQIFDLIADKTIQDPWQSSPKTKDDKKILHCAQETIPEVLIHFRTALTGPGTSTDHLLLPYAITPAMLPAAEHLCAPLLRALHAHPIVLNKKTIPNHYSLHPESAATIYKALKGSSIKSKEKFKETFSLPFPFFDLHLIFKITHRS
jgi:hypothetical protein